MKPWERYQGGQPSQSQPRKPWERFKSAEVAPSLSDANDAFNESTGTLENFGNNVKAGWYGLKSTVSGLLAAEPMQRAADAEQTGDWVEMYDPAGNPVMASELGLFLPADIQKKRVKATKSLGAAAGVKLAEETAANSVATAAIPMRPATRALTEAKTFEQGFSALAEDPIGVIGDLGVRSSVQMAPALAVTLLSRNPAFAALAAGSNSAAMEYGSGVTDYLAQIGVNTSDAEAIKSALQSPDVVRKALDYATTRAGIVGTFDAASGGLASKVLVPGKGMVREALNTLVAQPALQAGLGAGGEASAQLATTGEIRPGEVLAEAAGEMFTAPLEAAIFAAERRASVADKVFGGKGYNPGDVLGDMGSDGSGPADGGQPPRQRATPEPMTPGAGRPGYVFDEDGNVIEQGGGMVPAGPSPVPPDSPGYGMGPAGPLETDAANPDFIVDPAGGASAPGDWRSRLAASRARSGGPGMGPAVDGESTMAEPDMAQAAFDSAIESIQATIGRKPTKASLKATATSVAARFGVDPEMLIQRHAKPVKAPVMPEPIGPKATVPTLADVSDTVFQQIGDIGPGGELTRSYVSSEDWAKLKAAGLVETGTTAPDEDGDTHNYEYVPTLALYDERERRNKKANENRKPLTTEEHNAAVERRASFYDRIASEQDALGDVGDVELANAMRAKAADIRKGKRPSVRTVGVHPNAPQEAPAPVPTGKMWRRGKSALAVQTADGTWFVRVKRGTQWQAWQKRETFDPSGAFGYSPYTPPSGNVRINGKVHAVGERRSEAKQAKAPPDVIDSIIAAGGLNREEMRKHGIDPRMFGTRRGATKWVFPRNGGMTLDALRQRLIDDGYFPPEDPDAPPTISNDDAFEIVQRALNQGERIVSTTHAGAEAAYQEARNAIEAGSIDAMDAEAASDYLSRIEGDEIARGVFDQLDPDEDVEGMSLNELVERALAAGVTPQEMRKAYDLYGFDGEPTADPVAARNLWELIRTKESENGTVTRTGQADRGNGPAPAPQGPATVGNAAQRPETNGNEGGTVGRDQPEGGDAAREQAGVERRTGSDRSAVDALPANERDAEIQRLRAENAELQRQLDTDPLTGVLSRAAYERDIQNARGVATIDLKQFKGYNTVGGQTGGDLVLKAFAKAMQDAEADGVRAYRPGGDEFAFLSTDNEQSARDAADRLQQFAADIRLNLGKDGVTYSIEGVPFTAGIGHDAESADTDLSANKGDYDRNALPDSIRRADQGNVGSGNEAAGDGRNAAERDVQGPADPLTLTDNTVVTPPPAQRPASQSGLFGNVTAMDVERLNYERAQSEARTDQTRAPRPPVGDTVDLEEQIARNTKTPPTGGVSVSAERLTPDTLADMSPGAIVVDDKGREYRVHSARHKYAEAHPMRDGKPDINRDTKVIFHLDPASASAYPERNHSPIYATGRTADSGLDALYRQVKEQREARDKLARELVAQAGEFGSVEFVRDNGEALVGPDMSEPGRFRITRFDDKGPFSHSVFNTMAEAVESALKEGYQPKTPTEGDRNAKKPDVDTSASRNAQADGQANPASSAQADGQANPASSAQADGQANPASSAQADGQANPASSAQADGQANPASSAQADAGTADGATPSDAAGGLTTNAAARLSGGGVASKALLALSNLSNGTYRYGDGFKAAIGATKAGDYQGALSALDAHVAVATDGSKMSRPFDGGINAQIRATLNRWVNEARWHLLRLVEQKTPEDFIAAERAAMGIVDAAASEAAASPENDKPEPTEAQKEAGNYAKGHVRVHGLDFAIETPAGTSRRPEWPPLANHYGYIKRTEGADGEHVDVFFGPRAEDETAPVFVVDQFDPKSGKFDEHKVMLGFSNELQARTAYLANYAPGWKGMKSVTRMSIDDFKSWLRDGDLKQPVANIPEKATPTKRGNPQAPEKIADFGEKIGGARKDVWSSFKDQLREVSDDNVLTEPLSKTWPQPDYQKMIDDGADSWVVAFVRSARDEIPRKPNSSWKQKNWAMQVKQLRDVSLKLLNGDISTDRAKELLAESRGLRVLASRIELYQLVGHAQSLAGVSFEERHYSLYKGRNNVRMWVVEKATAATAFSNWPRELATGDTKEQMLQAFKEKVASLQLNPEKAKVAAFDIYSYQRSAGYFIGKKVGRNHIDLAGPFTTVGEARAYRDANNAALVAKLEASKEIPNERRDTNNPRVGEDMRNGQDVTPKMFGDAFGFKGVEFGNWVEQTKRQSDLNEAFDALMDMAAILGIPPKAISLNGELGIAFGARGSGGVKPAAAHYEPGKVVINLTKKNGAGSLGHEWWHALDNYFQRMRGKPEYATEALDVSLASRGSPFVQDAKMRKEMVEAFGAVVSAIKNTAIKARSAKLDAKRTKEYWTTGREMTARAFESYLITKLQDQNASNDYLANIVDEATWSVAESIGFELDGSYPYPTAGEVPIISAAFDKFFDTIESREGADGKVELFSNPVPGWESAAGDQLSQAAVDREVSKAQAEFDGVTIEVMDSIQDAPTSDRTKRLYPGANGLTDGKSRVWIFRHGLQSLQALRMTLAHEIIGHIGVERVIGADWPAVVDAIKRIRAGSTLASPAVVNAVKDAETRYPKADDLTFAREAVAIMAENGVTGSLMDRIVAAVRKYLRKVFGSLQWSDAEIRNLLRRAGEAARKPAVFKGAEFEAAQTQFSQAGDGDSVAGNRLSNPIKEATTNTDQPAPPSAGPGRSGGGEFASNPAQGPIERTMRENARSGQSIDKVFRSPFQMLGMLDSHGRLKLGTKLADAIRRVLVDMKPDPDGVFGWAAGPIESLRAGIIDRYGIPADFVRRDEQRQSEVRATLMHAARVATTLENLTTAEAKVLQAMLTGQEIPAGELGKLSEPIKEAIDQMGREAVEMGLISPEAYERNRGAYLHRSYLKYEVSRTKLGKMIGGIMDRRRKKLMGDTLKGRGMSMERDTAAIARALGTAPKDGDIVTVLRQKTADGGVKTRYERGPLAGAPPVGWENLGDWRVMGEPGKKTRLWRDFTPDEREKMGEILDARYNIVKTFSLMAHDLATGKFLRDIAANPEWAVKDRPENANVTEDAGRYATYADSDWVRVPDAQISGTNDGSGKPVKRYGALAGMYVRAPIWRDLNQLQEMQSPGMWGGMWKDILTQWKTNKTARNPVVHMNNVMSNLVFMDLADVRLRDLYAAIGAWRRGEDDADYRDAMANGAFGGGFADQELKRKVLDPILDKILREQKQDGGDTAESRLSVIGALSSIWDAIRRVDGKMLAAYNAEDEIFRLAFYLRRQSLGDTTEEAARAARRQFLDYDIRAPWVNAARNSVLPFIGYTYRAIPVVAQAIAERPWKLAKYATMAAVANWLGYLFAPGDEEEERRVMSTQVQGDTWVGSPRMIRMPWSDGDGNPVFLDVRRWIPAGDVFDLGQNPMGVPSWLQMAGPLQLAGEFATNMQAFTQRPIVDPLTDTPVEKAGKVASWLWKGFAPNAPWVPESYSWDKLEQAATGQTDVMGRDFSLIEAASSTLGIKAAGHDVDLQRRYRIREFDKVERELDFDKSMLKRELSTKAISRARFDANMARIIEKEKRLNEKRREVLAR